VRPIDREQKLVRNISQEFAGRLAKDAARLESSLPDPKTKPITHAMTVAYTSRLRARGGIAGICNDRRNR
jgi:hypothetical protein